MFLSFFGVKTIISSLSSTIHVDQPYLAEHKLRRKTRTDLHINSELHLNHWQDQFLLRFNVIAFTIQSARAPFEMQTFAVMIDFEGASHVKSISSRDLGGASTRHAISLLERKINTQNICQFFRAKWCGSFTNLG